MKKTLKEAPQFKVFSSIPKYGRKRIFGTENEYGTGYILRELPPLQFIPNGGRIYLDCGHVEYASPETSNPLEAVVFEKAGELISRPYSTELFKNNVDSEGHDFGAHENYFTRASTYDLITALPFFVTRHIYAGSGRLRNSGRFELSQKIPYLSRITGSGNVHDKALISTKQEDLSRVAGWRRLHLTLGDANMCEVADFLKLGTTSLVLDLIEDGLLPDIGYKYAPLMALDDARRVNSSSGSWKINGTGRPRKAIGVQRRYLEAAKTHYQGRDEITDELLNRWEFTLDQLDRDPMQLVGSIDWVTKLALIQGFAEKHNLPLNHPRLRNIDLQYHDLDRRTSLFYRLQESGGIERLVSDDLINQATKLPPKDTRANFRGRFVTKASPLGDGVAWDYCVLDRFDPNRERVITIPDPFDNYDYIRI
ncbi:MAG TPA: proteasome accessory factor PafA2 family protein [Candidatus Nanoarchaeia archaeon]|nr:proteasome accessory factor PafA2 family protein [Candidatus Nanoarchaeia archaeon]